MAIQRAEDKTASLRARSVAIEELTASGALPDMIGGPQDDDIDRELAKLGPASSVEAELARMKRQLPGAGGATVSQIEGPGQAPQLPQGGDE